MKKLLITIDGPAGAGKTTVSRMLADRLGYRYIDTGALYRAVALGAIRTGIAEDDDSGLAGLMDGMTLEFKRAGGETRLYANSEDISDQIRTPEISLKASAVSARPVVRDKLLDLQRAMARQKAAVFEGRDMGTVVFPEAEVKFFLDADLSIRALRRHQELSASEPQNLETVESEMQRRDRDDSTRVVAPLRPAADAVRIDSSTLSAAGVVERMLSLIERRLSIKALAPVDDRVR